MVVPELLYAIHFHLGVALWQGQALEETLVHFLILCFRADRSTPPDEVERVYATARRVTLGNLVGDVSKRSEVPDDLKVSLAAFVTERNWLIHHSWREHHTDVHSRARADALIRRLEAHVDQGRNLNKRVAMIVEEFVVRSGVSREYIDRESAKLRTRWAEE